MNFESNHVQVTFAVIAVAAIAVSYNAFRPQTSNSKHAISTDTTVKTNCAVPKRQR